MTTLLGTPQVASQTFGWNGEIRSMTVRFAGTNLQYHFRLNKHGITAIKSPRQVSGNGAEAILGTYDPTTSQREVKYTQQEWNDLVKDGFNRANHFVTKITGKTRWLPNPTPALSGALS